ncbi:restriction endonuclease [Paenibacillus sepulcri]|uniref:Restriction endonuclease n=1 Tax=Paenibacillus sepulcri TaxID=359917 RepID=A0ABS7BXC8_9BACL|nr:restriction endonuclease [Paenibacillus sepulcri]
MKHTSKLHSITASELEFQKWREIILSEEYHILDIGRCFPSEELEEIFLEHAHEINEEHINTLLRRFLMTAGESSRDTTRLEFYKNKELLGSRNDAYNSEYYKRLASEDRFAWEGLSWIIDLLPDNPKMAIDVINAYELAHLSVLDEYDIYGMHDATLIIRKKFIDVKQPRAVLLSLSPREFELLVDALYEKMGYKTTLTSTTRDGGLDVIAESNELGKSEKIIVECKRHESDIGPDYIRALTGVVFSERATKGVLVATSNFTKESVKFAMKNGIELINHDDLVKLLNLYLGSEWSVYLDRIIQIRRLHHVKEEIDG